MNAKYTALFEPVLFPKRNPAKESDCGGSYDSLFLEEDGSTPEEELPYVARRSADVGLFIKACYAVTDNGKAYPGEPLLTKDCFVYKLSALANSIKRNGAVAVLQLHYGGAVCPPDLVPNGEVVAPSAIETPGRSLVTPRELSPDEIELTINSFGDATKRAIDAGFDGVELHGAYGYLLQQFFSPYSNRRDDRWQDKMTTDGKTEYRFLLRW